MKNIIARGEVDGAEVELREISPNVFQWELVVTEADGNLPEVDPSKVQLTHFVVGQIQCPVELKIVGKPVDELKRAVQSLVKLAKSLTE